MIAVDTSALMAIIQREAEAEACKRVLEDQTELLISAATVAEALIVAGRRNVRAEMMKLIDGLGLTVVPVSEATAKRAALAYERWGKGVHPAGLNFCDCFSYVVAADHSCPLLFVGSDFSRTDLRSAAAAGP